MKQIAQFFAVLILLLVLVVGYNSVYTVKETEQVIITQFGQVVGDPVTEAGLHFKIPFVQTPNVLEKRILDWDGRATEMTTKDKTFIEVDTFGRWRISDPKQFFLRLRDERSALSRLDGILGSATKDAIADNALVEVIRSTKGREPQVDDSLEGASSRIGTLPDIEKGRVAVEEEIFGCRTEDAATVGGEADRETDYGVGIVDFDTGASENFLAGFVDGDKP